MVSCGDGDDKSKTKPTKKSLAVDLSDTSNHASGSHFYSQSFSGGEAKDEYVDDLRFLQITMPFEDTVLLEDAFATQVMNFGGEMQTLEDLDCFENFGTQWLDEDCGTEVVTDTDTDSGGTEVTEALGKTRELSDDDSVNRVYGKPVDQEKIPYTGPCKEFDAVSKEESNVFIEKCSSESLRRGFISIRVASLRASGLAARGTAFKGINTSENQSLRQLNAKHEEIYVSGDPLKLVEEIDHEHTLGKYDEQMKRLTNDNTLDEIKGHNENADSEDVEAEKPLLFASENEFEGLSYLDSHEAEELSEANALDFVDRFLKGNVTEFDLEVDIRKSIGGKSKPISIAKGAQTLAKRANLVKTVGERGTFDWDDSSEDGGRKEFFRKKKELFVGTGDRMCSSPQDSRLDFHNLKENDGSTRVTTKLRRNLIKELDKASTERMVETGSPKTRAYTRRNSSKNMRKCSPKGETENRVYTRQSFLQKKACSSNLGVITRQSKQRNGTDAQLIKDLSFSSLRCSTKNKNQCYRDQEPKSPEGDDKEQFGTITPIACRTRQSVAANQSKLVGGGATSDFGENMNDLTGLGTLKDKRKRKRTEVAAFAKDRSTEVDFDAHKESDSKTLATTTPVKIDIGGCPGQRTRQNLSSVGQEIHGKPLERLKRLRTDDASTCVDLGMKRKTGVSACDGLVLRSGKRLFNHDVHTVSSKGHSANCETTDINGSAIAKGVVEAQASKPTRKNDSDTKSPRERCKLSVSDCNTPVDLATPIDEASPICMGDEYLKHSYRKKLSKLSLMKEINCLSSTAQEHTSRIKGLRRKRDLASVKVFFSHHLDEDIIKQQKKVLARLGASIASSISEATHFIANNFVRTRHMLEAIAFGKPVVSHLWLDSCGQASCLIDERNYILRDAKKEKEFGFSLPVSLARASEQPLLKGIRVLITPNTKPGKEILASLVKVVHGLVVERMGIRSLLKDERIEDDLLILSCQEDYTLCVPLLQRGAGVYSSELLLNGIVTQKLEYQRHRLFAKHVKRTRSTMWLCKDGDH